MTNQLSRPAAQPAHAADRFAREIVGILAPSGAALAAADAQAVGRGHSTILPTYCSYF